jgi:hypothetical protein
VPLKLVTAEDSRFHEHHVQSETFGGGIFNDAFVDDNNQGGGDAPTIKSNRNISMRTFACLNGDHHGYLFDNMKIAAKYLFLNSLLDLELDKLCTPFKVGANTADLIDNDHLKPYFEVINLAYTASGVVSMNDFHNLTPAQKEQHIKNALTTFMNDPTVNSVDDRRFRELNLQPALDTVNHSASRCSCGTKSNERSTRITADFGRRKNTRDYAIVANSCVGKVNSELLH